MRAAFTCALALLLPTFVLAAPVTFDLNYTTIAGNGTATGTFTVDDADLVPNHALGLITTLDGLIDFQIQITGINATPNVTSFDISHLTGWVLTTDASGDIADVNFFMDDPALNQDGFSINGFLPLELHLHDGTSSNGDPGAIAEFLAAPSPRAVTSIEAVPTISTWVILILAIILALAGGRRARVSSQ